jgi:hypothetical protein
MKAGGNHSFRIAAFQAAILKVRNFEIFRIRESAKV